LSIHEQQPADESLLARLGARLPWNS
jgi:hypothetical protein